MKAFLKFSTRKRNNRILLLSAGVLMIAALLLIIIRAYPAGEDDIRRSVCLVKGRVLLCLANEHDTLVLRSDTIDQQGVWINKHWWWPSCNGRVLTIAPGGGSASNDTCFDGKAAARYILALSDSIRCLLEKKEMEAKELNYYLQTHNVLDEGYTRIAQYAEIQKENKDSLHNILKMFTAYKATRSDVLLKKYVLSVTWFDREGHAHAVACKPTTILQPQIGNTLIIHVGQKLKAGGVYAAKKLPWFNEDRQDVITATITPGERSTPFLTVLVGGEMDKDKCHNLPGLFAVDGSPVFSKRGRFIGVVYKQKVLSPPSDNRL